MRAPKVLPHGRPWHTPSTRASFVPRGASGCLIVRPTAASVAAVLGTPTTVRTPLTIRPRRREPALQRTVEQAGGVAEGPVAVAEQHCSMEEIAFEEEKTKKKAVVEAAGDAVEVESEEEEETTACPPRLCKDGYSTSPSIETLEGLPGRELAAFRGLTVRRAGFGSISWPGPVDLRGLDLGAAVDIERRKCSIDDACRPLAGAARTVQLLGVASSRTPPGAFEKKVIDATAAMGATLVSFAGGEWVFSVTPPPPPPPPPQAA